MTMEPDGTRRVQWGTGSSNASSADTTTGQIAATPSPKPQPKDSTSASVDGPSFFRFAGRDLQDIIQPVESLPFPPTFQEFRQHLMNRRPEFSLPEFTAGKQGYLVKITREQLETAEVFPLTIGQAENIEERTRRQEAEHARQVKEWEALQEKHPELGPIIKLHAPNESLECSGCDGGPDYGGDWPCRTIETIQEDY